MVQTCTHHERCTHEVFLARCSVIDTAIFTKTQQHGVDHHLQTNTTIHESQTTIHEPQTTFHEPHTTIHEPQTFMQDARSFFA